MSSTLRQGSQEPRIVVAPKPIGYEEFDGNDCVEFSALHGLDLDPYQALTVRTWMRRDAAGRWVADSWGLSVSRQNGKNAAVEAVEVFGAAILGLKILHTAHEVKTARKAFLRLLTFFENERRFPSLTAKVKEIRKANGQEAIVLHGIIVDDDGETAKCPGGYLNDKCGCEKNPSIEFIARSKSSGRGFTADLLVLDEAQELQDEQLESILPAISAAPSGDPATIYLGTPPTSTAFDANGRGGAFLRVRNGAVTGESTRTAWVEFSLDLDLDAMTDDEIKQIVLDDDAVYATNPALGRRIAFSTIAGEREKFAPRSFARERFNVWPVPAKVGTSTIDVTAWEALGISEVPEEWPLAAIGLDMDPATGRLWTAVAAHSPSGVHVELLNTDPLADGTDAFVTSVFRQVRKRRPVVIPYDSPAMVLAAPLLARGVRVYQISAKEQAAATGAWKTSIKEATLSHFNDEVLYQSIIEARDEPVRTAPGQTRFARTGDLSAAPLYAAVGAAYGAVRWSKRRAANAPSSRKVALL